MSTWTVVLVLVVVTARYAGCYIEPVEERGCQDTSLRLTCRHLQAHIAILNATFSTDATLMAAVDNTSCDRGAYAGRGRPVVPLEDYDIREALNYR
nr:unnamed protein product [Timema californicum]